MPSIRSRPVARARDRAGARLELRESLSTWSAAESTLFKMWLVHLEQELWWRRLNLRQEDRLREKAGIILDEIEDDPVRALREIVEECGGDIEAWFVGKLWPFRAPKWQRLRWRYTYRP